MADVRLQYMQVARLVLVVCGTGVVDICQFVECQLSIEHRRRRRGVSIIVFLYLPHASVPRLVEITIMQAASARDHLQTGMKHSHEKAMLEGLMEIANLPQFVLHPTLFHQVLKSFEL